MNRPWLLGPAWEAKRFDQTGWRILPLRLFLAVTFIYASLQKLANPNYLDASSPASVVGQMKALESTSPIGPLLRLSLHAPTLVGLLIAFGELAVGVGVLVGLWTRLAAVGGALLSLTFFLTVSWSTTPYFYGSDIVFVFAWTVFIGCGAGGVLSLDAWIRLRAQQVPTGPRSRASGVESELIARRTLVLGARAAGLVALAAGAAGALTAVVGRAVGGTRSTTAEPSLRGPAQPSLTASPSSAGSTRAHHHHGGSSSRTAGVAIGKASRVSSGQAARFNDPATGEPAWLVHSPQSGFVAFSAVCTHAGCSVGFDSSSQEFRCPCHGGRFDAGSGRVLGGPPPAPLRRIAVHVVNNEIRVD
ncbi:MAG: DoxX family membrane protein [Frankiaceae bacterium]|nr:DoxX family membrane protein [Frankiaceae bacterium]MBV9870105.1 DoxX family membrane protein [Frankiaceae bacterium]